MNECILVCMRSGAVLSARSCNRYNAWGGAGGISLQDEHDGHVASCLPLLCVVPASSVVPVWIPALHDGDVRACGPDLRGCFAVPAEPNHVVAGGDAGDGNEVRDGRIFSLEVFAERIGEARFGVPAGVAAATRTATARLPLHIVAV